MSQLKLNLSGCCSRLNSKVRVEERPGFLDQCNLSLWGWLVMHPGRQKVRYGAFGGGDKFLGVSPGLGGRWDDGCLTGPGLCWVLPQGLSVRHTTRGSSSVLIKKNSPRDSLSQSCCRSGGAGTGRHTGEQCRSSRTQPKLSPWAWLAGRVARPSPAGPSQHRFDVLSIRLSHRTQQVHECLGTYYGRPSIQGTSVVMTGF